MLIGIVGAPNKGKSTMFSALTMNDVAIADYPFTTIDPNKGVCYATKQCVEKELHVKCNARNSLCLNGTRMIPINIVDVAGLVEGAHQGKGMGNQFLNDLISADALIIVVDMSGTTDQSGNPSDKYDITKDIDTVINEITEWLCDIIDRNLKKQRVSKIDALSTAFSGMRVDRNDIDAAISKSGLNRSLGWSKQETKKFALCILEVSKKIIIAANKIDKDTFNSKIRLEELKKSYPNYKIVACSAATELALKRAEKSGIIDYFPGSKEFNLINTNITNEQKTALEYMKGFIEKNNGTGIQSIINCIAFELLDSIVVYPVEDDNHYSDHFGKILPDAVLVKKGCTTKDLAATIHTEIAKTMLYAIDAKTKMRIAKDHVLKDDDVIKIISAAK